MNDKLITKIWAEEIKDSRGNPTIKVTVSVGDISGSFSVPSGASTGAHEAWVIENDKAIFNVNEIISKALVGKNVLDQKEIDKIMIELDGTPNKNSLGGNSLIGVSIAVAKTAAKFLGQQTFAYLRTLAEIRPSRKVPYLYMNLINGGKHANDGLAFQEYLVVPETDNAKEALEIGIKIDNFLKEIIKKDLGEDSLLLGDEGGFAPKTNDIKKPLLYLIEAIKKNNLEGKVRLALDVAASSFFKDGKYKVDNQEITKENLLDIYVSLIKEFNLLSIEDPFDEEDFESFAELKEKEKSILVVGDDLTVTNILRLKEAIENKSVGAMIIKPNQIGTLTETLETMKLARENNIELIVSHRSGETDDDFIADLAFAFGCFGLKAGAPTKPERMVKYERLIKISNY
ncbi:MAG: enolase C-terminal domain-like protein [Minisyncoccia bacterium]